MSQELSNNNPHRPIPPGYELLYQGDTQTIPRIVRLLEQGGFDYVVLDDPPDQTLMYANAWRMTRRVAISQEQSDEARDVLEEALRADEQRVSSRTNRLEWALLLGVVAIVIFAAVGYAIHPKYAGYFTIAGLIAGGIVLWRVSRSPKADEESDPDETDADNPQE